MNIFLPGQKKIEVSTVEYDNINNIFNDNPIYFMNHGFLPTYSFLDDDFIKEASLYCRLIDGIETDNKIIVDIGCGRGGGVYVYNKYYNFAKVYGCDLNKKNIDFCMKFHSNDIKFNQYNAEQTEYDSKYFDIITNLESSHDYENIDLFINEAKRILKDDGIFIHSDIFYNNKELKYVLELLSKNFLYIEPVDITENVRLSCLDNIVKFDNIQDQEVKEYLKSVAIKHFLMYNEGKAKYMITKCKGKKYD